MVPSEILARWMGLRFTQACASSIQEQHRARSSGSGSHTTNKREGRRWCNGRGKDRHSGSLGGVGIGGQSARETKRQWVGSHGSEQTKTDVTPLPKSLLRSVAAGRTAGLTVSSIYERAPLARSRLGANRAPGFLCNLHKHTANGQGKVRLVAAGMLCACKPLTYNTEGEMQ